MAKSRKESASTQRIESSEFMAAGPTYHKKCPICGHPALEHRRAKAGEPERRTLVGRLLDAPIYPSVRYCNHPIEVEEDLFQFCDCIISDRDYMRVGNSALIRSGAKPLKDHDMH
jgi:hypothetical protein